MFAARIVAVLLCVLPLAAQAPRPERVLPSFGEMPLMLAPGSLVSIYGHDLGPAEGCRGYGDQQHWDELPPGNPFQVSERIVRYPTSLCGVQVKIGDVPAGLLWVQADQINFSVPVEVPFGGSADLRVIHAGGSSAPVQLRFGIDRMILTQDEPAFTGMPVWVDLHTAHDLQWKVQYPIRVDPMWAYCEDIEVRRNGVELPRQQARNPMGFGGGGNICGHLMLPDKPRHSGRLPLHLFYRFDQPGEYEVRYSELAADRKTVRVRSEWATIHVLAAQRPRAEWLAQMAADPPQSATEMLSDYLPSLMGYGDPETLPLLEAAMYLPDATVRAFAEGGMLDYYDRAVLFETMRQVIRRRGLQPAVAAFMDRVDTRPTVRLR